MKIKHMWKDEIMEKNYETKNEVNSEVKKECELDTNIDGKVKRNVKRKRSEIGRWVDANQKWLSVVKWSSFDNFAPFEIKREHLFNF